MIPLLEARRAVINELTPVTAEGVDYQDARGRVLAKPLIACLTQPPFAVSAMDGYAVRSGDLGRGAQLALVGESAAGRRFSGTMGHGQTVRVSTGAPIPDGADQIVIQENVTRDADQVTTDDAPAPGRHIRRAGVDFAAGDTLLAPGLRLRADAIALIAGCGAAEVTVRRRPRVGILATGNELVEPGHKPGPDQIINSVSKGMAAFVTEAGGDPVDLGIARDSAADVRAALERASGHDLVVTIGGASVGDHDHLRPVFSGLGGQFAFEKIALRPGKPSWFGELGGTPFLGLPGNPVSALVVARLLLTPALQALLGQNPKAALPLRMAEVEQDLPANGPRETFLRARLVEGRAALFDNQDSSVLSVLARADCLIHRPADAPALEAGAQVGIFDL